MHTPQLPVVDWTDAPANLNGLIRFAQKTKSGFCTCAITFQTQSTKHIFWKKSRVPHHFSFAFTFYQVTEVGDISGIWCRVQLKCDGTRWCTGGELKGKLVNGVGSQYPPHYLGTWCIQHYYRWYAHLGCQQSTELTPPADLIGLVCFTKRQNLVFVRVPSLFKHSQYTELGRCPTQELWYINLTPHLWLRKWK